MSLIICSQIQGLPYLVGDLLISNPEKTGFPIPTHLNPVDNLLPRNQKRFPSNLKQKLYIINDYLCLCIAGALITMKEFLQDIRQHFAHRPTNYDEIEFFIQAFRDISPIDLSYCIVFAELKGNSLTFRYFFKGGRNIKNQVADKTWVAGSGDMDYMAEATEPATYASSLPNTGSKVSLAQVFLNLGKILAKERFTLNTISKYWGGGFEVITFDSNKFKKIDDITYIILRGVVHEGGLMTAYPIAYFNFVYYNSLLVLTSFAERTHRFGITSVDTTEDELEALKLFNPKSTLVANKYCCFYILDLPNGNIQTPSLFTENNGDDPGLVFIKIDEDNKVVFHIRKDVHDSIALQMKNYVAESKN